MKNKKQNFFKKSLGSASIYSAALATTLIPYEAAHAINVGAVDLAFASAIAANYTFNQASGTLSVSNASAVHAVNLGNVTDGSVANTAIGITSTGQTADAILTIGSLVMDNGTSSVATMTDVDDKVGDFTVNVTNIYTQGGSLIITNAEVTNNEQMTVDFNKAAVLTGAVVASAGGSGVNGDLSVKLGAAATFTGGITMNENALLGTVTLVADGAAVQTIIGTIDGTASAEGVIETSNAGAITGATFASAIGGIQKLRKIQVTSGIATFSGQVEAAALIVSGTASMNAAAISAATTLGASGVLKKTGNATHTGNIDGVSDGVGTITLMNATATQVTGDIGTAANSAINKLVLSNGTSAASKATIVGSVVTTAGIQLGDTADNEIVILNLTNSAVEIVAGAITTFDDDDTTSILISDSDASAAAEAITFTGVIGETAAKIDTLQVGSATVAGAAVFNEAILAKTLSLLGGNNINEVGAATVLKDLTAAVNLNKATADAVLTYGGTTAQTSTGLIEASTAGEGKIIVTNTAGTTFTNKIGNTGQVGELELATGSIVTAQERIDIDLLDMDGTADITLSENANDVEDFTMAATTIMRIAKTVTNGETLMASNDNVGAASIADGAKIFVPINLTTGQTIVFLTNTSDTGTAEADFAADVNTALQDTFIMDYTAAVTNTDDATITATAKSSATTATELGIKKDQADALLNSYNAIVGTAADEVAFQTAFEAGTVRAKALADQVAPQTDVTTAGTTGATKAMTGTIQSIVSDRLASLRSGDQYSGTTGVAAGDGMSANSGFFQAFGAEATQKDTKKAGATVAGYESDTTGFALGFDGQTNGGSVVGLSLSYSETDVEGKGAGKATNDIESYSATLYADKVTEKGYIEGSLTFGLNDNSVNRKVTAEGLARSMKANYDSEQVSLRIGGGVPNEMSNGSYLTPFASATVTNISTDAYTETSNVAGDNLALRSTPDDVSSILGTVGLKAHMPTASGTPSISLALNNEFGDTVVKAKHQYNGGGTAFNTKSEVEELSATLGLGYTYDSDGGLTSINVGYEGEANDDKYLSHYGSIKLVTKF